MIRIGQGYDAHRFKAGNKITLGGVEIAHDKSFAAHSDGDVVLHALCDALLGAAAMGDIGQHFPDTDATYKGISSRLLVRQVIEKIAAAGFVVGNVDMTIIAQAPRLAAHIPAMRGNIAEDLQVDVDCVNVKATTTEKMGFEGRGEGISAHACALLQSS